MDNVNQANYDYLADIQDILLKMDGKYSFSFIFNQFVIFGFFFSYFTSFFQNRQQVKY